MIFADNYLQAKQWATVNQDIKAEKDFIRCLRENNPFKSNAQMTLDFVLRTMLCSDSATYSFSYEKASLETGIPPKTIEYNLKKFLRLGIVKEERFPCRKDRSKLGRILTVNLDYKPKVKKILKEKKLREKNLLLQSRDRENQSSDLSCDSLLSFGGVAGRDFFSLGVFGQAVSLLSGAHGVRCSVYPSIGKAVDLYWQGINYSTLTISQKVLWLSKGVSGLAIKVPKGMVLIDCDSEEAFEEALAEYYCGGFIVKSPRGGKILVRLGDNKIPRNRTDVEFHGAGRLCTIAGDGYKFLSMDGIGNFKPQSNLTERGKVRKSFDLTRLATSVVEEGSRNEYLFRLGRSMKAQGFSAETVGEVLRRKNASFSVALPKSELEYLCYHVFKYRNRYDWR